MFENYTYETILNRMTNRIPKGYDVREGSIIFNALAACAAELASVYIELDWLLNQAFGETAGRDALENIAYDTKGLTPRKASPAIWRGSFSPSSAEIPIGGRWNCGEVNFTVTEKIEDGAYRLICETAGAEGNSPLPGTRLVPLEYTQDVESASLVSIEVYGDNEESTEEFRERWKETLQIHSFGGNIADYREKALSVEGVGGCKVYRADAPGADVRVIIIGEENTAPSETLVNAVQTELDPNKDGEGDGLVPIGHTAAVSGVTEKSINVGMSLTLSMGITVDDVQSGVCAAIDGYFAELAAEWEKSSALTVRISEIIRAILTVSNVEDVSVTSLNGGTSNVILASDEIPKRGKVTCTESEN